MPQQSQVPALGLVAPRFQDSRGRAFETEEAATSAEISNITYSLLLSNRHTFGAEYEGEDFGTAQLRKIADGLPYLVGILEQAKAIQARCQETGEAYDPEDN